MHRPNPKATPSRRVSQLREVIENSLGLVVVLVFLIAVFSFQTSHFFSTTTFEAIANEIPTAIFIAIGMTFVLVIGGIDLSVGSVLALGAGILGVAIVQWHWRSGLQLRCAWYLVRFVVCSMVS